MRWPRTLLAVALFGTLPAVAAPVPDGSQADLKKLEKQYGTWTDPARDCKFRFADDRLLLLLPGSPHPLDTRHELTNTPRVLRKVDGDFSVQVRLKLKPPTNLVFGPDGRTLRFSAGLMVFDDRDHYLYYGAEVLAFQNRQPARQNVHGRRQRDGTAVAGSGGWVADGETVTVRVVRAGNTIRLLTYNPQPNLAWFEMDRVADDFPPSVFVGIFAAHNSQTPFEAEFADYLLERTKP